MTASAARSPETLRSCTIRFRIAQDADSGSGSGSSPVLVLVLGLGLVLGTLFSGSGCRGARHADPHANAILYLSSNVRDAQLYVDGHFVAPLLALHGGISVIPGTHRLELRSENYFSSYLEVAVTRAERRKIALPLAAMLP